MAESAAASILNSKLNSIVWPSEHLQHQQPHSLPFKHGLYRLLLPSSAVILPDRAADFHSTKLSEEKINP